MKNFFLKFLILSIGCNLFCINLNGQPTITNVSPNFGLVGSTVTISGTNFSNTISDNIVYFGGVKAIINSSNSNSIVVTVPNGVSYSPISVTVNGLSSFSRIPFNVTYPEIRNITSNSFDSPISLSSFTNCYDVIAVDLDGDGLNDIANVNYIDNSFSAYKNLSTIGTISFGSAITKSTGRGPILLKNLDVDNDGKQDIIIVNNYSGSGGQSISIFRNISSLGNILFASEQVFSCPSNTSPEGITVADLDLDGKPDICVTSKDGTNNYYSVFRNTSTSGSISFASRLDFPTNSGVLGITNNDLDGDGKIDLAMVCFNSNNLHIAKNTSTVGSISFTNSALSTLLQPYSISNADLDQDGKQDLIIGNYGADFISIFKNTSSSGSISFASRIDSTSISAPRNVFPFDFNGDQKIDILVNHGGAQIRIFENYGNGISIVNNANLASWGAFNSAIADIDGDGYSDIVSGTGGNIKIFRNILFETKWNGNTSSNWDDSLNWNNDIPGLNTLAVINNSTNSPSISGSKTLKKINILSNSTISLSNGSNLIILDSLINNGTISGNGQISFNGNTAQVVSGNGSLSNININNINGVSLSNNSTHQYLTGSFTKTTGNFTTNNNFTLRSTIDGTARINQVTSGSIIGNVTVERYIPAGNRRFRFISSPVSTGTLNGLLDNIYITGNNGNGGFDVSNSNNPSAFRYNETVISGNSDSGWEPFTSLSDALSVGRGYRILIRGDRSDIGRLNGSISNQNAVTLDLSGSLNQGDITPNYLTYTNSGTAANDGWNLMGNPYASNIDWNAIYDNNDFGNVNPTMYQWNAASGSYVDYNASSNSGTGSQYISSFSGFFVQFNGTPSATFKESRKTTNTGGVYFKANQNELRIKLKYDSSNYDLALIKFIENGLEQFDRFEDSRKLMNETMNVFSFSSDNVPLSTNLIKTSMLDSTFALPLFVEGPKAKYTLEFDGLSSFEGRNVYLLDHYLNTITKLTQGIPIQFNINEDSQSTNNRFVLSFNPSLTNSLNNLVNQFPRMSLAPNPTNDILNIQVDFHIKAPYLFEIFNLAGNLVNRGSLNFSFHFKQSIDVSELREGMYIIKLSNEENSQTLKFFKSN